MSFRLRLTLLYTGLMATALLLFSLLLYGVLRWTFVQAVDANLVRVGSNVSFWFRNSGELPPLTGMGDQSVFVLVRTTREQIKKFPSYQGVFPLPKAALEGEAVFSNEVDPEGTPYRLYTIPILVDGNPFFYVQVAQTVTLMDTVITRTRLPIALGTTLFVGIAAVGAWWVAIRAIRPVEELAEAAREIGESGDLSYRVPHHGADDEVGLLVETFNSMLDHLQGVYARLAASVDAQQRFVADASHELRTPLTIIRGNIDYLRKSGELDLEAIADIASEAERMSRMVEELLTMARADAGQAPELSRVELGPLLAEACRKAQALPHEAAFKTVLPDALNRVTVMGNAEWLIRALLILIDNAFKYCPTGSVTVRAGRQGDGVVVQVIDTGVGIAKEDLPHIFERFYRADRARARGGAGLGLAIARWVAEVHGGRLTAESSPGKGSRFSFWLPLPRSEESRAANS